MKKKLFFIGKVTALVIAPFFAAPLYAAFGKLN